MQSETPIPPLSLSLSQAAIVDAIVNGEGNLAVLAAAGSGKTHTVAAAVVALVKKGVPLSSILVVTFGKAACIELHDRIAPHVNTPHEKRKSWASYTGDPPVRERCARTYHSLAYEFSGMPKKVKRVAQVGKNGAPDKTEDVDPVVDRNGYLMKVWAHALDPKAYDLYQYKVYRDVDAGEVADNARPQAGFNLTQEKLKRQLTLLATLMYAEGVRPGTDAAAGWLEANKEDPKINDLFIRFNSAVAHEGFYTFGDQFIKWYALDRRYNYKYVIIDEAQDNDPIQTWLARKLAKNGRLIMIGDLRQTIHEWKGASTKLIEDFIAEPTTRTLHLSENRRSVPSIVALGNALVKPYSYGKTPAIATRSEAPGRSKAWGVIPRFAAAEAMLTAAKCMEKDEEKRRAKAQCAVLTRTWDELLRYEVAAFAAGSRYTMNAAKRRISEDKCQYLLEGTRWGHKPWEDRLADWEKKENRRAGCSAWSAVLTKAGKFAFRYEFENWVEDYFDESKYTPLHLGTAHTSKGMTIDTVIVVCSENWAINAQTEEGEVRLFYVAVTRAQNELLLAEHSAGYEITGGNLSDYL